MKTSRTRPSVHRLASLALALLGLPAVTEAQIFYVATDGQAPVSLDQSQAEEWLADPAAGVAPEEQFDRDWAEAVVGEAMRALERECEEKGQSRQFSCLRPFLSWDQGEPEVTAAANELGMKEGALRVAVHRLRHRFRVQLRAQVAHTVATPQELDAETDHLFRSLLRE